MVKEKLYPFDLIVHADYKFDLCEEKEEFLELLKTSTPQKVAKFSRKGTKWDIGGDYGIDFYKFFVNGGKIFISTITENIEGLLDFLVHLAYYDTTDLILGIHDEGSYSAITALAIDEENIRFTVFDYGLMRYKKVLSDIIINKKVFIKQFYGILSKLNKDMHKLENRDYVLKYFDKYLASLKEYLDNPDTFKKTYDINEHVRVFDIAYKDLNGDWQFLICFDDDERCEPEYWEKQKSEGKILDYDYQEQDATDGYVCINGSYIRCKGEELRQALKPDMQPRVEDKNWVFSTITQKWYAGNDEMPEPKRTFGSVHQRISYSIEIDTESYPHNEEEQIENYIKNSTTDYPDDLECILNIKSETYYTVANIKFLYSQHEEIRKALNTMRTGEYIRFDLGAYKQDKMHIWLEKYSNQKPDEYDTVGVACFELSDDYKNDKEVYYFLIKKDEFINCFILALDEIQHKIDVMSKVIQSAERLKIPKEFKYKAGNEYSSDIFENIENFIGGYACVNTGCVCGYGIINEKFEWVIKPEYVTIWGKEHPKFGKELKGWIKKYSYLHNINGKLFIAAKEDLKQFVMDINGDIKIPHISDKIYYTYLNNELYFIAVDYNKSYLINSKGEDILTLDFPIGEKFWLFKDILIVSRDNKYGIVDRKGKVLIDFIFSDIKPDPNNLDFIPAKYMDKWGFINKKGKVINMKVKENAV